MEDLELLEAALTDDQFKAHIREASATVEAELAAEDQGWINFSQQQATGLAPSARVNAVRTSRTNYYTDPMAAQAIRLWTDYSFGPGMTWSMEDDKATEVLKAFWNNKKNASILGARGQRMSSDKLLVDGDIFFVLFLGAPSESLIRRIDPLEITEIVTNPDDIEDVRYYRRQWMNQVNEQKDSYYRSTTNLEGKATKTLEGSIVTHNELGIVYHLTIRTLAQRGTPLLLPAHFYLKYNKKYIASRISIMLALTRFAWKTKVKGGQADVDAMKAKTHDVEVDAGSTIYENMGVDTKPIKTETGANAAYQDGRMIKLQIAAASGIPEQYFGDISIGNLATAKTVELPMQKMFKSYQKVWGDAYQDMIDIVLAHDGISEDKWYVDMKFPPIAPQDIAEAADAVVKITNSLPEFKLSEDIRVLAMELLGINDPAEALEALSKLVEEQETKEEEEAKARAEELSKNPPPNGQLTGQLPQLDQSGNPIPPNQTPTPQEAIGNMVSQLKWYRESLLAGTNERDTT